MFKIANAALAAPLMPGSLDLSHRHQEMLAQFSVFEAWQGDFSSGMIRLGDWSSMLHGLSAHECGLLSLLRCYDPKDRGHIIALLEQATTVSSSFCFSTTIMMPNGLCQPVFCMGQSSGVEKKFSGSMAGVFIFPRFTQEGSNQTASRDQAQAS
ncbi:hypothetical protein [Rhizobium azibense]|uniref:hypothetical protein n=1 Tax=Rhizobium azibense TaxID=1136135 RepID=UPI0010444DD0|nr:hypothetical protein [Rhizobium azibense]